MRVRISAVIPTYNEEDIIYWTIQNLVRQDIFVYVLDNESTDATARIAKEFPSSCVSVRSFHTGGQFHERIQGECIRRCMRDLEMDTDWLIKNDADEFLEAPFHGMYLREGIELADREGSNCVGARAFVFFPMSEEVPHVSGEDVRLFYDYFRIWNKSDRWTREFHPQCDELWKLNVFKCRADISYVDPHRLSPTGSLVLFPHLFILRHYPYRHPERTRRRLLVERRARMSLWNLENQVSCHYAKYTENTAFFFDDMRHQMQKWSQFVKSNAQETAAHRFDAGHLVVYDQPANILPSSAPRDAYDGDYAECSSGSGSKRRRGLSTGGQQPGTGG